MSAVKRIQQGIRALFAFTQSVDYQLAERYLNPEQMALFRQMEKSEQLHSLNVLHDVLDQEEYTPDDLAVAALLHDAGKIRYPLAIWQKTLSVLVKTLLPALDARLIAEDRLSFWRAPFVVRHYHPGWGGELLRESGASDTIVWLVTHHADSAQRWQTHPSHSLLLRLQEADNAN